MNKCDHRLWPGKTSRTNPGDWHPATFHCLDVAAVANQLASSNPAWMRRLARSISAQPEAISCLFSQLIALHDIGKLSESFCRMVGFELPELSTGSTRSPLRHWEISYQLLRGELDETVRELTGIASREARIELYAAVAGHHGQPPAADQSFSDIHGVPSARAFVEDLINLLPRRAKFNFKAADAKRLSWSLAGLTVASDWIGSNEDWFCFKSCGIPIEDYWSYAKERAKDAVSSAGLACTPIANSCSYEELFGIRTPRPMQECCASIEVQDTPTLFVLEDATGSGKTESSLLLAHRMMQHGLGEGVYVALPTTATADAMFSRLGESYRRLYESGHSPSIALAHGRRVHNEDFTRAIESVNQGALNASQSLVHKSSSIESKDVSAFCSEWIASDQRKTFLAEVGVGTIDQAFFAILPVKHSVLRLFGLGRRILIVDEAHACDPYMEEELCRLLEMQGLLQGSAIVMTATLTSRLRSKLIEHYRRGLGVRSAIDFDGKYPLLSVARADDSACEKHEVEAVGHTVRTVLVQRIASFESAVELASDFAKKGAAVAWIRNTVDDAIAAFESLKELGHKVELFHARFALGDRLNIEKQIVSRYGKSSNSDRAGWILVATQVVESSLDLDFDVLVTDLAPADSLIQRAGRLWRHMDVRPCAIRPVSKPILHVLSPDPDDVADDKWGQGVFGGTGFVYGLPVLWRTALALFKIGEISAPHGLSILIESALADEPPVPAVWERLESKLIGVQYADQALSKQNAVQPRNGYLQSRPLATDASFPTRADLENRVVNLVRRDSGELLPLLRDDNDGAMSVVGLRERFLKRLEEAGALVTDSALPKFAAQWPQWRLDALLLVLVEDNGCVGDNAHYDAATGLKLVP